MNGFIKLFRQFKEWEWYSNNNVKSLFIHCLLSANFKDKKWQGTIIKRGQFVTSLSNLADELGLTVQNIRTALEKLTKTGELTKQSTSIYTVITVCKYDSYQVLEDEDNTGTNKVLTNHQQTTNKRLTNDQQQLKKDKNNKNVKNNKKDIINNIQKPKNFDDELFVIFKDFLQMRKEIKKPFKSDKAIETRIGTLSKDIDRYGLETVKEAVLDSIANQYQGIFVKNFLDKKGEPIKSTLVTYTPPYTIPTFEEDNERWMFFMARYEAYKPYLAEYLINTEYRQRAIFKKDAEGLCYELEQQNPNLAQIQVQTA